MRWLRDNRFWYISSFDEWGWCVELFGVLGFGHCKCPSDEYDYYYVDVSWPFSKTWHSLFQIGDTGEAWDE